MLSFPNVKSPTEIRQAWPKAEFDVDAMKHLLDHDNHEKRDRFRQFLKDPLFAPRYNLTLDEERELALKQLQVNIKIK